MSYTATWPLWLCQVLQILLLPNFGYSDTNPPKKIYQLYQMEIIIKEVQSKKDLLRFIKLPLRLYKENSYYVPPMVADELKTLSADRNPAFEFCESKYWLAYKNNRLAGRIAGIINHKYNDKIGRPTARFGWLDFVDDQEVVDALFQAAETWASEKKAESIHGPLGFSEFDASGILIEGFQELATPFGKYNFPYYPERIEKSGYKKDKDWVEFNVKVPETIPEKYLKAARIIKEKYKLQVPVLRRKKDLLQYATDVFQLLNQAYEHIYGYCELSPKQMEDLKRQFIPLLRLPFVSIVLNAEEKLVGFAICLPSLSKALQKAKGKMYPFGMLRIFYALRKNDTLDTLLIAIHKDYIDKGVNAILFSEIGRGIMANGITHIETTRELEDNLKVQNLWNKLEIRQHKRCRCYIKQL